MPRSSGKKLVPLPTDFGDDEDVEDHDDGGVVASETFVEWGWVSHSKSAASTSGGKRS